MVLNNLKDNRVMMAFILSQFVKAEIILINPFDPHFLDWFFGFSHLIPYSFDAFTEASGSGPVPYSLFWYVFNYPLSYLGYWAFFITILSIDTLVLFLHTNVSYKHMIYLTQVSSYVLLVSPQDYFVWLFVLYGARNKWCLILAPLIKAPLLPPYWWGLGATPEEVWNFMLFSPTSIRSPQNSFRYAIYAMIWVVSLVSYLRLRAKRKEAELKEVPDYTYVVRTPLNMPIDATKSIDNISDIGPSIGRPNNARKANLRSVAYNSHRACARWHSRYIDFFRVNRTRRIHIRAGVGSYRTPDFRRHYPIWRLRSRNNLQATVQQHSRPSDAAIAQDSENRLVVGGVSY
ncbi:MAG TPA: hypothetical protein VJ327_09815 [Patescibacteria group bacterium]|nr:hypothetical protein [Patescibacteria group bacterium]